MYSIVAAGIPASTATSSMHFHARHYICPDGGCLQSAAGVCLEAQVREVAFIIRSHNYSNATYLLLQLYISYTNRSNYCTGRCVQTKASKAIRGRVAVHRVIGPTHYEARVVHDSARTANTPDGCGPAGSVVLRGVGPPARPQPDGLAS